MRIIVSFVLAVAFAFAPTIALAASPEPSPSAAPQLLAQAKDWLGRMQSGNLDASQLTQAMQAAYTDDVKKTVVNAFGPFGPADTLTLKDVMHKDGNTGYLFDVTFHNGTTAQYVFAVEDATGKISGLRLTPSP